SRGHVPVDPPHIVAVPVGLVLVEVEAGAALRARVRTDAQVADALPRVHLDVAQLPHDVLGDHGIGTASSSSPRIWSASMLSACARPVRALRWREASE